MPHLPGWVLVSSAGWLYAADLPFPVEMSALVMVGLILKVFLRRDDTRMNRMEIELASITEKVEEQRHLKHLLVNQITGIQATLALILPSARACECGKMAPLVPVLERLSTPKEPTS